MICWYTWVITVKQGYRFTGMNRALQFQNIFNQFELQTSSIIRIRELKISIVSFNVMLEPPKYRVDFDCLTSAKTEVENCLLRN
jgi:hypothetical protein